MKYMRDVEQFYVYFGLLCDVPNLQNKINYLANFVAPFRNINRSVGIIERC